MPNALDNVPGLAGYLAKGRYNQERAQGELQQYGALQQLLAQQEAQQEAQQLKGVLAQAGGDPARAVQALLQSGTPKAVALAAQLKGMLPKPAEPYTLGNQRRGPNNELLAEAPFRPEKPEAAPEIVRLQNAAQQYPEGHPLRAQIEARIKILGERPPGVTVNMPASSDTVQGTDGKFYKFRIGKDGKPEVIPFQTPTGEPLSPPETPAAGKDRVAAEEEATIMSNVRKRVENMASLIRGGGMAGGVVGPLGMASRIGETVTGMASPSAPTPALDYQNEMRLLLSDVRKMVEKDPNLSKDEREAMYETLGGGTMQTPGSALRTLNNILNHVESKQRTPRRTPNLEATVKASGWSFEPNKYDYRVIDGKVQRKAK